MCQTLYDRLDKFFDNFDREPLPVFSSRYPHRMESILGSAKLASDFRSFDIVDLAAYYLVFISRGHPLIEGNKRLSVACCLGYLWFEGYYLDVSQQGLYEGTVIIAKSSFPQETLRMVVAETFRRTIKRI